ncbi:regulatory protein RecX [Sphingomonas baiyangensis]|uniref:Regulatory protein RecX n=1 Tax=Sphingomonas baiyangensis TaxID=2572576 RepID=A0A4U1L1N2_9SPHN|nr:RecX family transcriptional regulator [Sphingomonas baiyangensis]TKD49916.1 regulatory protein RecX [Sphingomonas baiyangensis]
MRTDRPPPSPLDREALERMTLRYVGRYATTRAKLATYLRRKQRERGWHDSSLSAEAAVERMVQLCAERGYVDDRGFGEMRAASMARRGLGARRVAATLRADGLTPEDAAFLDEAIDARSVASAVAFARRRRIGPFAADPADRALRDKQIAAMVRAGHSFDMAREIVAMSPMSQIGEVAEIERHLLLSLS